MRFRKLPSIRAADRALIVPADNIGLGTSSPSDTVPSDVPVNSIADALDGAIQIWESSRNSLHEPIMHLAASAEALAAMAKAISDRAGAEMQPAHAAAGDELKTAIDQLTAKIEQLAE